MARRVAVIGAGPSGLVMAKEAVAAGLEVVVFEREESVGGTWVYSGERPAGSAMYESVVTNVSRPFLAYSDFPLPESAPTFPTHRDMVDYFRAYAEHFALTPLVRLGCAVTWVRRIPDGWEVRFEKDGRVERDVFDAVAVSNGHHQSPRWPEELPGQASFGGTVMHSHAYRTPTYPVDATDKRIVVVGIGNSACDIAAELSRVAREVTLSTRSGGWIFPRRLHGKPVDWVDFESRFHKAWMRPALARWLDPLVMWQVRRRYFGPEGNLEKYGLVPKFGPYEAHAAVNDEILSAIEAGRVRVKPGLRAFRGPHGVELTSGERIEADIVIFATGYAIGAPFLEPGLLPLDEVENQPSLYKEILNPDGPPTLAFVGLVQPQTGFMPVIEMQARWVVALWTGRVGLPSPERMKREILRDREERQSMYVKDARHTIEVEWPEYSDWFARELGVMPTWREYLEYRGLLLFEPIHGAQYRLRGPGANIPSALEALRSLARARRAP